jgi:hypothetical protein
MNTDEINKALLDVGEKIKAKGWQMASINIYVSYLGSFDREPGPLDPMISYRPSISATPHRRDGSFRGSGGGQEYVSDGWDVKDFDDALARLHKAADAMPTMAEEADRIDQAAAKLSESERRLLGVR